MSKLSAFVCSLAVALPLMAQTTPQEFVDFAGQTDMTEAHAGQLAQQNGESQAVKDYGQMLTTDHTSNYDQLTAAATKANLNVPKGIDSAHWAMVAPLEKMKGHAFDHKFITMMIAGHEAAIAKFKKEAADGQNADIKAYAEATIPVLQKHLDDAKALEKNHTK